MRSRLLVALVAFVTFTFAAFDAAAQPEGPRDPNAPWKAFKEEIEQSIAALAAGDCVNACRALASIRRSAERICALTGDESPRCSAAKAAAEDARRRVLEACPDCAVASASPKDEERRAATPTDKPKPAPPPEPSVNVTAQSAPAPERRGGCASCTASGTSVIGDPSWLFVAAWAAARLRRRKRS